MEDIKINKQTVTSSEFLTEYCKALGVFQSKCPIISENKKGYNYKYADLPQIVKTITPWLKEAKLSYTQPIIGGTTEIGIRTILFHTESGQHMICDVLVDMASNTAKGMSPIQGMGSVISYLRRYVLCSMLGIVSEEDTDGALPQKTTSQPVKKTVPKTAPKAPVRITKAQLEKTLKSDSTKISNVLKAQANGRILLSKEELSQLGSRLKELKTITDEKE